MPAFDRLTPAARTALRRAAEEAERDLSPYLGTEHLLLGLRATEGGAAARVLAGLGFELDALRAGVGDAPLRRPRPFPPMGAAAPTTRLQRAIAAAYAEARRAGRHEVTTGALLVGLLVDDADGLGSRLLLARGVTAETVRAVLAGLGDENVP
ncbi:MAG TPA: Clp protease N-terminal domain-containing protein [Candidatus Dormibacteraeota bacterium]|nr:Clp protease N-terminal domain-containing protein [Candidatus Dormibacteraeota bacterium]